MKREGNAIELLAPAKDAATAICAIECGADAVYMGATSHGARKSAANSIDDLARVADFAHRYDARVYATVNTLIYEDELTKVERLICKLYRCGVDALIVQDMGVLKLDIPPIALHASTQCDIRSVADVKLMEALGFSQVVLARELNLQQISDIKRHSTIPLEAFIHGAVCVSYSGCCNAGFLAAGRSGNRGECPQICRLNFNLIDGDGTTVIRNRHFLSLKDMNRYDYLSEMIKAGVSSFKIEGRLKDIAYVKNVVTAYRQRLDKIIESSDQQLQRSSQGNSRHTFIPDLSKSFNRGYSSYFLSGVSGRSELGSHDTPKMKGEYVGEVQTVDTKYFTLKLNKKTTLANGDGLVFFTPNRKLEGLRVNKAEENKVYFRNGEAPGITVGAKLFRNFDKEWEVEVEKATTQRVIAVNFKLYSTPDEKHIILDASDQYGNFVAVSATVDQIDDARQDQNSYRQTLFSKLGETYWELGNFEDEMPGKFVAASLLTALRRQALDLLERARRITRPVDYRRPIIRSEIHRDAVIKNIANSKALQLSKELGINGRNATEVFEPTSRSTHVMECKYCLRRELGTCLREPTGSAMKEPLYLDSGKGLRYRLRFDCSNCKMWLEQT